MPESKTCVPADAAGSPSISAPGFVGRDGERAALSRVLSGPPGVVLVEGEAGIGKSRLVREVLAVNSGRFTQQDAPPDQRVLVAACPPFRQPYTLGPVVDAVRQSCDRLAGLRLSGLAGALRPLFPEWATDLPPAPEPAEDATAARHRLFRALAEMFDILGVAALVVEDAHWADEATLEFALFLASGQPQRVTLVVTYRPEDVPPGSLLLRLPARLPSGGSPLRLALESLNVTETARFVSSMLTGQQVSRGFAALLQERTEGIPLAIEESVRVLYDRADLTLRDGAWTRRHLDQIVVPRTIRDAVLERVGRLELAAQAVLRAAAVLTDPTEDLTLFTVAGLPPARAQAGLDAALESGILQEDNGLFAYRHVLAGRAVYEAIPASARRAMHERAGVALEARARVPVTQLARHFREAGDVARWSQHAERAADLALVSGDEVTAAKLVHDLVTNADLPAASVVALVKKVLYPLIMNPTLVWDLIGVLRSVLDRTSLSRSDEAQVRFLLGRSLLTVYDSEACHAELHRAVRYLPAGSFDAARAMTLLGVPRVTTVPAADHRRWLYRAAAAADSPAVTEEQRLALLVERTLALLMLGEESGWDEAAEIPDDPATAQQRLRVAHGHLGVGEAARLWGRYGEATRRLDLASAIAEDREYQRFGQTTRLVQAHMRWFTGAWDGLREEVTPLATSEDIDPLQKLDAHLVLGHLDAAVGESGSAQRRLRFVLDECRSHYILDCLAEPAAALARLDLAAGRIDDALQVTKEPLRIITDKGLWLWAADLVPVQVDALIATDRVAAVTDLMRMFTRGLGRLDAPASQTALALGHAIHTAALGQHARAARAFARVAEAWQALPRPYDALLAQERQALCYLAAGQRDDGLGLLVDVRRRLHDRGATADADRIGLSLREHGVVPSAVWRGGRRGYGDALSPRELEVVRLVATGRTNQEIASALSRSPKTVATQLNSAMRKLQVTSRTALAMSAVESGIVTNNAGSSEAE